MRQIIIDEKKYTEQVMLAEKKLIENARKAHEEHCNKCALACEITDKDKYYKCYSRFVLRASVTIYSLLKIEIIEAFYEDLQDEFERGKK